MHTNVYITVPVVILFALCSQGLGLINCHIVAVTAVYELAERVKISCDSYSIISPIDIIERCNVGANTYYAVTFSQRTGLEHQVNSSSDVIFFSRANPCMNS
jgi:hypothetical protein